MESESFERFYWKELNVNTIQIENVDKFWESPDIGAIETWKFDMSKLTIDTNNGLVLQHHISNNMSIGLKAFVSETILSEEDIIGVWQDEYEKIVFMCGGLGYWASSNEDGTEWDPTNIVWELVGENLVIGLYARSIIYNAEEIHIKWAEDYLNELVFKVGIVDNVLALINTDSGAYMYLDRVDGS